MIGHVDLKASYMGLELAHPIVASAGPLSKDLDGVRRLEDGGAAAIVLFSLFEEQIARDAAMAESLRAAGTESFAESLSYFPEVADFRVGPDRYLDLVRRAREATRVPIIASLNGTTEAGWLSYARLLQEAGASAIELNVYYVPADLETSGREVEDRYVDVLRAVKAHVTVPVAIKVGPFFSAFGHMAKRLDEAGADALVLFNRFYQPDFDLERREVSRAIELSSPRELRIPLLWLAVLFGKLKASLAASSGVETPLEVVKALMAGADVVMTTSALLRHGPSHLGRLRAGLAEWLSTNEYRSVAQLRGSMSHQRVPDASAFERANYVGSLASFEAPRFSR